MLIEEYDVDTSDRLIEGHLFWVDNFFLLLLLLKMLSSMVLMHSGFPFDKGRDLRTYGQRLLRAQGANYPGRPKSGDGGELSLKRPFGKNIWQHRHQRRR